LQAIRQAGRHSGQGRQAERSRTGKHVKQVGRQVRSFAHAVQRKQAGSAVLAGKAGDAGR
jgi:hypothetical protein